jgi:hypothetical protein
MHDPERFVDFSGLDHARTSWFLPGSFGRSELRRPCGGAFFLPGTGPEQYFWKRQNPSNNNAFRPRHLPLQFAIGARRPRRAEMMAMVHGYGRNQIMQRTHS